MHSCLVGRNDLSKKFTDPYQGRSSILSPLEYTQDLAGVLAEAPDLDQEAFLTAEWDFTRLEQLINTCDTPVNKDFRMDLVLRYYNNC